MRLRSMNKIDEEDIIFLLLPVLQDKILEMDSGDGCTMLTDLMPVKRTLKNG